MVVEEHMRKSEETRDYGGLAQRIAALETRLNNRTFGDDVGEADKSMMVIGGFPTS